MQEQVPAGHLPAPAEPGSALPRRNAVQGVECPGEDEPFDDGAAHPGPGPEVAEVGIRLTGENPGHLGGTHPGDVGKGEPDAVPRAFAAPSCTTSTR